MYNTCTLPCGLRIIHLPLMSQVVYCGYAINAGTRDESAGEEGIAHFCEHLSFKGTDRRRAIHIINSLERVGGELNAFTSKEHTVFYAAIQKEHFPRAVDLLTDIVFHSTYPQFEVEREVEVVCDEIESYNDSPAELIYDEFEDIVFRGHPLGHNILGEAEQLRTYTSGTAKGFTSRNYLPQNIVFFVYGDLDFTRLAKMLQRSLSEFPPSVPDSLRHKQSERLSVYMPEEIIHERNTHQAHVMMGYRAFDMYDDRRIALYLINNILGGPGMNARLNLSLRERRGLVYTVESNVICYSDTGLWSTYFGCAPKDINRCRRLALNELRRIAEKPLSPAALSVAKRQIKGQIAIANDNREGFALNFAKVFLHTGRERDVDALFSQIDAVSGEDIMRTASSLFAPDNITTLVFM